MEQQEQSNSRLDSAESPQKKPMMSTNRPERQMMQETIAEYFKTQPVLKAWLFGSFARGEETPRSDVDILFVPDYSGKPFTLFTHGGMLMDLQELLNRKVDLVVEGTLRPYAAETANRDKILIYERKSEG
jgi:predicted nucleotidyltransferase